jgi:ATP-dependent RNA helicase SUPV3L1/SUV3
LAPAPALSEGLRRSIEEHHFERLGQLTWRNSNLDLLSIEALLASLHQPPTRPYFNRSKAASDVGALERLGQDPLVARRARGEDNVRLLWLACQIPDYRQGLPELHAELVKDIFLQLTGAAASLSEAWLETSVRPLDDTAGDIDALTARIASVRTWTYLSNHSSWVPNDRYWVERTRDIEDRLSDALHERLVERFVERRRASVDLGASARSSERRRPREATPAPQEPGPFSALRELQLRMAAPSGAISLERWVEDLVAAPHERFRLDADGRVFDDDRQLGQLSRGTTLLRPELKLTFDGLDSGQRLRLSRRLSAWSRDLVNEVIGHLNGGAPAFWSPAGRGLIYQLEQNLGSLPAHGGGPQLAALTPLDQSALRELGVRVSRVLTYATDSLRPRQRLVRLALTRTFAPRNVDLLSALHHRVSIPRPAGIEAEWLCRVGFVLLGPRAVRIDVADRARSELAKLAKRGAFALPSELAQWLGCSSRDAAELAVELGYRRGQDGAFRGPRRRKRMKPRQNSSA